MSQDSTEQQLNSGITIFSLIVIGAMGVMAFQVLPSMIIGMLTDHGR